MFIDILVDLFFSYRLLKEGIEDVVDLASNTAEYFGLVIKQPKVQESETSKTRPLMYSKTCLKRPLKKTTKNWFSRPIFA